MVSHPGTNRARHRVTSLIKTNVLPLSQTCSIRLLVDKDAVCCDGHQHLYLVPCKCAHMAEAFSSGLYLLLFPFVVWLFLPVLLNIFFSC